MWYSQDPFPWVAEPETRPFLVVGPETRPLKVAGRSVVYIRATLLQSEMRWDRIGMR